MEENNKKQKRLFIVGLVFLLLLVVGASYAYFAVTTINNFGTSTINAQAGNIGSVTLNGTNASLSMSLTAVDMVQGNDDITYYASSSGKTTTPTEEVIGTASVTPTSDINYYHCTYTLNVTHTGSTDMYTVFSSAANKSDGQIILTINGVDFDFYDGWPASNEVSGEFYIKGTQTRDITAGLRIINDSDINQNYLAGSDIQISISLKNNTFSCTVEEEPIPASTTLIALTEDSNNSSKISRYTGPVTDECGASTCTTVQSAQNVYVFTSNDINNVIFEDYCWKLIRTTETGGVKLLYNGLPVTNVDHQECTATGVDTMLTAAQMNTSSNTINYSQGGAYDKPAYVGYMYNPNSINSNYYDQIRADNVNQSDSLLKEKIEYWFSNSNIDESKLEDAVYCNDRSLYSTSPVTEANLASATSGDVYFKNYNTVSTLECTNITDSFNKTNTKAQTNYKVGFMTEPERYLMTSTPAANGQYYWLGSTYNFLGGAYVRYVFSGGSRSYHIVNYSFGVRPVVSTNTGVQITDGDGSTTSPFIFE